MSECHVEGHRLRMQGPLGALSAARWSCQCGGWSLDGTPAVGPWGRTTSKARVAQVKMAHAKHVKAAQARAAAPQAPAQEGGAS